MYKWFTLAFAILGLIFGYTVGLNILEKAVVPTWYPFITAISVAIILASFVELRHLIKSNILNRQKGVAQSTLVYEMALAAAMIAILSPIFFGHYLV